MMIQTLLPNLRSNIVRCSVCSVDVCAVLIGILRAVVQQAFKSCDMSCDRATVA